MEKIKDEELKRLQELVGSINNLQTQVGGLELQKHVALHQVSDVQSKLSEFQRELEEEYGVVSINLQDGTISKEDQNDED